MRKKTSKISHLVTQRAISPPGALPRVTLNLLKQAVKPKRSS